MRSIVKADFFWPFAGGFVLGTLGLFAMQPGDRAQGLADHLPGFVHAER